MQYPPNIRVIRLMCSGSLDPVYVLKALLEGADGVLIGGCHPGDCHYMSGNYKARRRVAILREILAQLGVDEDRVWLRWISQRRALFADTVQEMVDARRPRGPTRSRDNGHLNWPAEERAFWKRHSRFGMMRNRLCASCSPPCSSKTSATR